MTKDPKFGHIVGPFSCEVEECLGHRQSYEVTVHRLSALYPQNTNKRQYVDMARSLQLEDRNIETMSLTQIKRLLVKELRIKCFNYMTKEEKDFAIIYAYNKQTDFLKQCEEVARKRSKAKLLFTKKKSQEKL